MTPTTRPRRTRRNRLAWLLATKAAIALVLGLPTGSRRSTAEYRALGPLPGLEPGAPVTLAGQLIGKVVSMERRGDTTALRVWFVRGAERLPGSRTVRLRRVTLASEVTALEIRVNTRYVRPMSNRSFALGGWLRVLPPDSADGPFIDPRPPRPLRPPAIVPSPFAMPVFPPALPAPTAAPIART